MRPIGPSTDRVSNGSSDGPWATRPGLGRMPTTLQKLAGVRRLPPRSEPVASHTWPCRQRRRRAAGRAAAGVSERSHGLRVSPSTSLKVLPPAPNSGVFDLAMTSAPRASSRSTIRSDVSGTWSAKIGEP